jgi:PadR family transcriptional regulator PadR
MGKGSRLGEAEHLVLLAVRRLGAPAHGVDIRDVVEDRAGRVLTVSAIYVTLGRLEKKGHTESALGEALPVRGGKARRQYWITDAGHRALDDVRRQWESLWEGFSADSRGVPS